MSSKLTLARELAMDAFVQIMYEKKRPELLTEKMLLKHGKKLKRQDKALMKEILFGSMRWHKKIYWILQHTSKRDLDDSPPEVRAALILGTYQMFFLDRIPDRAAVNESVEYVRKKGFANAVSFTNGILRQIARRSAYFTKPDKEQLPVEYLALQFSHPEWIVKRWLSRFNFARLEEMLAANNKQPPTTIRLNSIKTPLTDIHLFQKELLRKEKVHSERSHLKGCLTLESAPDLDPDSIFGAGFYTIQDQSSQLIAHLVNPQEGEVIIDTCCGPGGKLSHVYELGQEKIQLIGVEKNPDQMAKAKDNMARMGHEKVEWVEQDFLDYKPDQVPDKILLDSPCSGLGVLKRHPEGKWHKDQTLVLSMAELQKKFIRHALDILKPGGTLVYSVCSFELEESENQLKWVRNSYEDSVEIISPVGFLPDYFKKFVTRDNLLTIFSGNKDRADGFSSFIVKKLK